jgi:hypothetical protein
MENSTNKVVKTAASVSKDNSRHSHEDSKNHADDAHTAVASSPLPPRNTRHQSTPSITRKRTNDEMYMAETPKASPTATLFQQQLGPGSPRLEAIPTTQQSNTTLLVSENIGTTNQVQSCHSQKVESHGTLIDAEAPAKLFTEDIKAYQIHLEQEFQDFEQSLDERDRTVELEDLEWADLEQRYKTEIQPFADAEQDIMHEFGNRFQV